MTTNTVKTTTDILVVDIIQEKSGGSVQALADNGISFRNDASEEGVKRRTLRALTTNSTPTALETSATTTGTITVADNTIHSFVAYVSGRCTGGAGGNTGKAVMIRTEFVATATAGTASLIGDTLPTTVVNQQDGIWNVTITFSTNQVHINAVGGVSDNITWRGWVDETTI